MAPARRVGATHVHVHFVDKTASRFSIETDLRRRHRAPLNEQPTPAPVFSTLGALSAMPPGLLGLAEVSNLLTAPSPVPVSPANHLTGLFGPSLFETYLDALLRSSK